MAAEVGECDMRPWCLVLFAVCGVTNASAQPVPTFAELPRRLDIGDQVTVERRTLGPVSGRVVRLTREEIAVDGPAAPVVVTGADVSRISARGDSLGNGMRLGAIIGGALGGALASAFSGEFRGGDLMQGVAIFGGVGLGLGLALDAAHVGRTTVFTAPDGGAAQREHHGGVAVRATWVW